MTLLVHFLYNIGYQLHLSEITNTNTKIKDQ